MSRRTLRTVHEDDLPAALIDQDSNSIVREAVDALAALRTPYWLGDSAVHLHALVSLIAQAQPLLPEAVHDARQQELTWTQIGQLLDLTPSTAARRFRNNP